jgi:hypothetical protein
VSDWYSERFSKHVVLTNHAFARMQERLISKDLVRELIETGKIYSKDEHRIWIYK